MVKFAIVEAGAGGHNVQVVLVLSADCLVLAVITSIITVDTEAVPIHQVGGDGGQCEHNTRNTNTCQLLVTCSDI